jgi:hypothetical protein
LTEEAGGVPIPAAWKAAQINAGAESETKPQPKAEPSNSTETNTDSNAESHIDDERGDNISADTVQMMGDGPTTKSKESGQPSYSPDNRLEHG